MKTAGNHNRSGRGNSVNASNAIIGGKDANGGNHANNSAVARAEAAVSRRSPDFSARSSIAFSVIGFSAVVFSAIRFSAGSSVRSSAVRSSSARSSAVSCPTLFAARAASLAIFIAVLFFAVLNPALPGLAAAAEAVSVTATADTVTRGDNTESLLIKAQQAYNDRDAGKTKEYCFSLLELDPENDAACYLLARVALAEQDYSAAEKFLVRATAADSSNYYYSATLAVAYVQQDKFSQAVSEYEKIIRNWPAKNDPYVSLINLYSGVGEFGKVFPLADKLEEIAGPNDISVMARVNAYRNMRDWDKALQSLMDAEAKTPSPRYESLIGDMYMDRMSDTAAARYYRMALASDSLHAPSLYGMAEIYRMKKNYAEYLGCLPNFLGNPMLNGQMKVEYMKQVLRDPVYYQRYGKQMSLCLNEMAEAHPNDTSVVTLSAMFMTGVGETEMAHRVLSRAMRYNSANFEFRISYLSFLYTAQYWEELERTADSTLAAFSGERVTVLQLKAIAEYNIKKYDAAISTFLSIEPYAKRSKDTALLLDIYAFTGDIFHMKKDDASAFKYYRKALKINPRHAPVLNNHAWYIATSDGKRDLDKALKMSKITIEDNPDNSTYLDTYAWILYLKGDYAQARKHLQHALAYGGSENATELEHYAEVLFALKEYDLAFIYFDRALNLLREKEKSGSEADGDETTLAGLEKTIEARKKEIQK